MTSLRVVPGVAVGVAIAACVVQSQPPAGPTAPAPAHYGDGDAAAEQAIPDGAYSCTIDDYQPFLCQVYTNTDGSQTLEKMSGSQRFRGVVSPSDDGFFFDGVFFCPFGDCTRKVQARFTALDDGAFLGDVQCDAGERPIQVALMSMPGGAGYGGVGSGYGGFGYGYGGVGYSGGANRHP